MNYEHIVIVVIADLVVCVVGVIVLTFWKIVALVPPCEVEKEEERDNEREQEVQKQQEMRVTNPYERYERRMVPNTERGR